MFADQAAPLARDARVELTEQEVSGVQGQSHAQVSKHLSDSSGEDCTSRPKSCQSFQVLIGQFAHNIVVVHHAQVHSECSKLGQHFPQHAERTQLQSRVDPEFKISAQRFCNYLCVCELRIVGTVGSVLSCSAAAGL